LFTRKRSDFSYHRSKSAWYNSTREMEVVGVAGHPEPVEGCSANEKSHPLTARRLDRARRGLSDSAELIEASPKSSSGCFALNFLNRHVHTYSIGAANSIRQCQARCPITFSLTFPTLMSQGCRGRGIEARSCHLSTKGDFLQIEKSGGRERWRDKRTHTTRHSHDN